MSVGTRTAITAIEGRIAQRLASLRAERSWSLDDLAQQTGISRATLSRIERCELSPTAWMLGRLCTAHGWTLSRLMADAETNAPSIIPSADQPCWTDPETRYVRRIVSPPCHGMHGELVEIRLPRGASVSFERSPVPGLEHYLWMLEGAIDLEVEDKRFRVHAGDCVRYVLNGRSRYECKSRRDARYLLALVRI